MIDYWRFKSLRISNTVDEGEENIVLIIERALQMVLLQVYYFLFNLVEKSTLGFSYI